MILMELKVNVLVLDRPIQQYYTKFNDDITFSTSLTVVWLECLKQHFRNFPGRKRQMY